MPYELSIEQADGNRRYKRFTTPAKATAYAQRAYNNGASTVAIAKVPYVNPRNRVIFYRKVEQRPTVAAAQKTYAPRPSKPSRSRTRRRRG